uniref:Peptidase M48 domain-containing protein n=1 Tax=Sphingobacterium sp. (strain 21) TaxID=743722 RepID=F4CAK3_SPHS2
MTYLFYKDYFNMKKNNLTISSEFRAQTVKAITAIIFFVLAYVLILLLALILTPLCIYAGIVIIMAKPMIITITLGAGLASLGVLILIFLVKFVFKSHRVDRSHLYEIKRVDEPKLFDLIEDIVREIGTDFPKKIYLSADVNAAVFYQSSFWSMFLPIKKNLQIGLGLVNTVTETELKAILSHEFGHFSQKTMKVGSYVYNVNQVIFNLIYDNDSYDKLIQKWAALGSAISIFVRLAVKIINGIQWILRGLYEIVNKSYLGLSREMEFHADEVAANVTGCEPLKNSLLRMTMASYSFDAVLNFYSGKINDNLRSENLFNEQTIVMNFYAQRNGIPMVNNLPNISIDELKKFNKSKLIIKDQWASHPSTEDRIFRLEKTKLVSEQLKNNAANDVFVDIVATQRMLTEKIFSTVDYSGVVTTVPLTDFEAMFTSDFSENSFPKIYNGYYDQKGPAYFEPADYMPKDKEIELKELFSNQKVDLVYTAIALQNDMETLKQIAAKTISIKTFDYDGVKYKRNEAEELLDKLQKELREINEQIQKNDIDIFESFKKLEQSQNKGSNLEHLYKEFFEIDKSFDSKYGIYSRLSNGLQFVNRTTPTDEINANFQYMTPLEESFKTEIRGLMDNRIYLNALTTDIKDDFENYLSKTWNYFDGSTYNDENLNRLFTALNNFAYLMSRGYFLAKKQLLDYQGELIKTAQENFLESEKNERSTGTIS